jgi:hypothetical protein
MEYKEFAAMFGLSEVQAYETELAAASVRIQALGRNKQANAVTGQRQLKAMEKQAYGEAGSRRSLHQGAMNYLFMFFCSRNNIPGNHIFFLFSINEPIKKKWKYIMCVFPG